MMFSKRHEHELAEVKHLTEGLRQQAELALERLDRINAHDQTRHSSRTAPLRTGVRPASTSPVRRSRAPQSVVARARGRLTRIGSDTSLPILLALRRPSSPLVAFVHIPKTAGGTVTSMFVTAYSKAAVRNAGNYVRNPEKVAAKLSNPPSGWQTWHRGGGRVSVGHVPYGLFREHLPPDTVYMTFLRDPVDRVVSHYHRHIHRRRPDRAGSPKELASRNVRAGSIEEALVEMRLPQLSNLATRFLCGHPSPLGELPASALDDAKANLRQFAFIGIQERFEESISLLQRTLGLDAVPRDTYEDRHVSHDRPTVEGISREERELIMERNRLDIELYAFGLRLFEDAITGAGEEFEGRRGAASPSMDS
jgi:hypothetical protein